MNSLSSRLTYRIMAVVLVMMAVITGIVYFTVRAYMLDEAKERYLNILRKIQGESRRISAQIEIATRNNAHDIERDIDDPEKMFDHMERVVRLNTNVVCCSMWFEPDYYPSKGRVFIPCARKDAADSVRVSRIDSTYHSYFSDVWFQEQIMKDQKSWTMPYYESQMFAGDQKPRLLTTFAVPIHNREGRPVALLCADMSLEEMQHDIMTEMEAVHQKFEEGCSHHSYSFSFDYNGIYVSHPDKQRMMNGNYMEEVKETPDTLDDHILVNMMNNENGSATVNIDGVPSWIYYQNIKHRGWIGAIVVPEEVIFQNGHRLNTIILLLMLFGLVALYFICRHQIRKTTKPLHRFALSADEVAQGNFSSPLPDVKGNDEVHLLHDAFANMQTSLSAYVDELKDTTATKASLERELKIANAIQMAMLPKAIPSFPEHTGIDLYASLTPARDVGGDLYDYFLRDNRLFFCIGDVSGKGMPAALMMAVMRAMFRGETRRADRAVAIVDTMNRNLSEEYTAGYFVTMFVGILDLNSGSLDYCNAGHEAPLLCEKGKMNSEKVSFLPIKSNLPVGALPDWNYEGQQTQLQPGDLLFLYTDGLNEAMNTIGEQFGRKHVQQLASEHTSETAQQLVELMETEVHRHVGDADQSDDITMLAVRWLPSDSLSMRASMDDIARLEPFITHVAGQAGIEGREAKRLRLAVEEAVANVINHGQATVITLQAVMQEGQLVLTIDDDGQPFDPTIDSPTDLSVPADQRPPGGLGIMLIHEMTDGLEYQRKQGHNILTIKKNYEHHD